MTYSNWYIRNIELEVRSLVYLLRNEGFNTTYSCGHALVIEIDSNEDNDMTRAHNLLVENGYFGFVIEMRIFCDEDRKTTRCMSIMLKKPDGSFGRP